VVKARSPLTISEYETDLRLLFTFIYRNRNNDSIPRDYSFADINFIKLITINDIYAFIAYCQKERNCTIQTCGRKIIAFRQFWKYLRTKARLLDTDISDELETPKNPKRIPRYLDLEDSIRLLINIEDSKRNYCIITLFLNCALRLAELVSLNVQQITSETVTVIGKGQKERQVYLTSAAKTAIHAWLSERESYNPKDEALFISNRGTRLTTRAVQILLKKAVIKAGLPSDVSPHKLRNPNKNKIQTSLWKPNNIINPPA